MCYFEGSHPSRQPGRDRGDVRAAEVSKRMYLLVQHVQALVSQRCVTVRYMTQIPAALCESHLFWMDDLDNIRGYPMVRDKKTGLYEHILFIELDKQEKFGTRGTTRIAKRILKGVRKVRPYCCACMTMARLSLCVSLLTRLLCCRTGPRPSCKS